MAEELRDLEEIKQEATEIGLTFNDRIGAKTLQERIDAHYERDSKANAVAVIEDEDPVEVEETEAEAKKRGAKDVKNIKAVIAALEAENRLTDIVKLTMVDKREASTATSARFSNGNMQMEVPLDVFVEMPRLLIFQAEKAEAMISMEKDGTSVSRMAKKYVIEYKK